jgi:glycosyltransferase involved in cell wall biosynthesis
MSCLPILEIIEKNKSIKWIYSSWGSDVYIFDQLKVSKKKFIRVLNRTNYYFSDCQRDYSIVKKNGFKGKYLGCFPGGGGYDFNLTDKYISKPASSRHTILVKGYQDKIGRSLAVIKALLLLKNQLKNYKIIVFSADDTILNFERNLKISEQINISVYGKSKNLPHLEIMKLMGESLIYIGNSISDGMPNTLIEAIVMGAFPIQSNPGGVTEEVITHKENGLLIEDPENIEEIKNLILNALSNSKLVEKAFIINQMEIKPSFEINKIKTNVLKAYNKVAKDHR